MDTMQKRSCEQTCEPKFRTMPGQISSRSHFAGAR
jgi:hypothetical protein